MERQTVTITEPIQCGPQQPLLWIAGPCVIESEEITYQIAGRLKEIRDTLNIPLVFKASFDKANRSSSRSYRGPGLRAGLRILQEVMMKTGLPVLTDIHEPSQAEQAAEVCDILQIPAFLSRQTDLVQAAGRTGKVVNVKKGQFLAPWDMKQVVNKLVDVECHRILLTDRGVSFGYNNLVSDMRAIPLMQETGYPVIFDATHSVQMPGAGGDKSSGDRRMVPYLARAATAVGCDGLFLEVHPHPEQALSDGPNMLPLDELPALIQLCKQIRETVIMTF